MNFISTYSTPVCKKTSLNFLLNNETLISTVNIDSSLYNYIISLYSDKDTIHINKFKQCIKLISSLSSSSLKLSSLYELFSKALHFKNYHHLVATFKDKNYIFQKFVSPTVNSISNNYCLNLDKSLSNSNIISFINGKNLLKTSIIENSSIVVYLFEGDVDKNLIDLKNADFLDLTNFASKDRLSLVDRIKSNDKNLFIKIGEEIDYFKFHDSEEYSKRYNILLNFSLFLAENNSLYFNYQDLFGFDKWYLNLFKDFKEAFSIKKNRELIVNIDNKLINSILYFKSPFDKDLDKEKVFLFKKMHSIFDDFNHSISLNDNIFNFLLKDIDFLLLLHKKKTYFDDGIDYVKKSWQMEKILNLEGPEFIAALKEESSFDNEIFRKSKFLAMDINKLLIKVLKNNNIDFYNINIQNYLIAILLHSIKDIDFKNKILSNLSQIIFNEKRVSTVHYAFDLSEIAKIKFSEDYFNNIDFEDILADEDIFNTFIKVDLPYWSDVIRGYISFFSFLKNSNYIFLF